MISFRISYLAAVEIIFGCPPKISEFLKIKSLQNAWIVDTLTLRPSSPISPSRRSNISDAPASVYVKQTISSGLV